MTNAEAWFNNSLRPRKPEGSLERTAQDGHLDSHTAPELCFVALEAIDISEGDGWGLDCCVGVVSGQSKKGNLKRAAHFGNNILPCSCWRPTA